MTDHEDAAAMNVIKEAVCCLCGERIEPTRDSGNETYAVGVMDGVYGPGEPLRFRHTGLCPIKASADG